VLHIQDLPVTKPHKKWTTDDINCNDQAAPIEQAISNPDFQPPTSNEPHFISQGQLNYRVGEINLSKIQTEFLGS
jgi:hypothetical protein